MISCRFAAVGFPVTIEAHVKLNGLPQICTPHVTITLSELMEQYEIESVLLDSIRSTYARLGAAESAREEQETNSRKAAGDHG